MPQRKKIFTEFEFRADDLYIMKKFRLLSAVFAGTLFYTVISVIAGRDGLWALSQLEEQKRILSTHAVEIEKTHGELLLEKTALQNDTDVIKSYARKLGYVDRDEKLVKIIGLPSLEKGIFDAGTAIEHEKVRFIREGICKMLGLVIFALVYLILLLADFSRGLISFPVKSKKLAFSEGTIVYDLQ